MKKLLTLLFALTIAFSLSMPAFSQEAGGEAPKAEKAEKKEKKHHKKAKKEKKEEKKEGETK